MEPPMKQNPLAHMTRAAVELASAVMDGVFLPSFFLVSFQARA